MVTDRFVCGVIYQRAWLLALMGVITVVFAMGSEVYLEILCRQSDGRSGLRRIVVAIAEGKLPCTLMRRWRLLSCGIEAIADPGPAGVPGLWCRPCCTESG